MTNHDMRTIRKRAALFIPMSIFAALGLVELICPDCLQAGQWWALPVLVGVGVAAILLDNDENEPNRKPQAERNRQDWPKT